CGTLIVRGSTRLRGMGSGDQVTRLAHALKVGVLPMEGSCCCKDRHLCRRLCYSGMNVSSRKRGRPGAMAPCSTTFLPLIMLYCISLSWLICLSHGYMLPTTTAGTLSRPSLQGTSAVLGLERGRGSVWCWGRGNCSVLGAAKRKGGIACATARQGRRGGPDRGSEGGGRDGSKWRWRSM
ncbi:unnamed protein product, partial [Discosporangium mesarthrocarpum]